MARTLAGLGMPPEEAGSVLGAEEPLVLGRYFELHRERLRKMLAEQLGTLTAVERVLALAILRRDLRLDGREVIRVRSRTVWIVVCEDFHGAAGPLPTRSLARDAANALSAEGS